MAPSALELTDQHAKLDTLIASDSQAQLGDRTLREFGRLPFLLKLLAVDKPLSIQAHPSMEQARSGYSRERAQGLSYTDPNANYRDDWPKPELLCPLTQFEALCGFRPVEELVRLFESLGGDCFSSALRVLKDEAEPDALRHLVSSWLTARGDAKSALIRSGLEACGTASQRDDRIGEEARFALSLATIHPQDAGVLVALLLQHLHLSPNQGLFVPAGVMHAYLGGLAVEVMASSDNVLRGGLTQKHVDVAELVSLVRFASALPHTVPLAPAEGGLERYFSLEVPHFCVSRIHVEPHRHWCSARRLGPEMMLCVEGCLDLISSSSTTLPLGPGECAWVSASEDVYCAAGNGVGFRVQVGAEGTRTFTQLADDALRFGA
jgi:mannose-6-phosphate isomerase